MRVEAATREALPFFDQPIDKIIDEHGKMHPGEGRALDRYVGDRKHLEIVMVIEDEGDFVESDFFIIDTSREPDIGDLALSERDGDLFVEHYDGYFVPMGRVVGHLRNQLARNPFRGMN